MTEALCSCDALNLEKKWINEDPKSVAFAYFVLKVTTFLDKLDVKDTENNKMKLVNPKDLNQEVTTTCGSMIIPINMKTK